MAVKRIIYVITLLAAIAAFIVANNGITLFMVVCLFALPHISLVMMLLASRSVQFDLSVRDSCIRGGTLQLAMRASVRPRFCVGCVKVIVAIENTTFHKTEYKSFIIKDLSYAQHVFDYNGADSGRICVKCDAVKLIDLFGIFSIKMKCPVFAEAIVSPMLYEDVVVNMGDNGSDTVFGDTALPKKGGDITEVFNVRDYAAGDPPNAVHWKLSGKFGILKSKEFGATDDRRTLILVDMSRNKFGTSASDEQLNGVLDVTVSISNALKSVGYYHSVGWFDDGEFQSSEVSDGDTFVRTVGKLMSVKVNDGNEENMFYLSRTAECAVFTKIIFVSAFVNYEEFKEVSNAEITAIEIGDEFGITNDQGVRVISIPHDNILDALTASNI
ncbi:MAG: DUF58 domain-containing protein [Clostridiales bacterium]|nr:DUF58 domain-containing protein [Clostridiales bacterium]